MKNIFGDNLKKLRGRRTQAEMANELGMVQQTYAKWEIGDRKPDINELANLALHFGVSVDWLLGIGKDDIFKETLATERTPPKLDKEETLLGIVKSQQETIASLLVDKKGEENVGDGGNRATKHA